MFLHQAHTYFFTFFLAGCIAQKMGLPIRLVAVVNSNDIIHRIVQHGDLSVSESVKATLASAMDIQVCNELIKMQEYQMLYIFVTFFPRTLFYLVYESRILPLAMPFSDALKGVTHIQHLCCRLLSWDRSNTFFLTFQGLT